MSHFKHRRTRLGVYIGPVEPPDKPPQDPYVQPNSTGYDCVDMNVFIYIFSVLDFKVAVVKGQVGVGTQTTWSLYRKKDEFWLKIPMV